MSSRIEKCLEKVGNRFMLATVVSRRWEQLVTGGRPMVVARDARSMQTVLREIEDDMLKLNNESDTIERLGEPVEQPVPLEGMEEPIVTTATYSIDDREDDEVDEEEEEEEEEAGDDEVEEVEEKVAAASSDSGDAKDDSEAVKDDSDSSEEE